MKPALILALMLCGISICWAQSGRAPARNEAEYYVTAYAQHCRVPIALARAIVMRESNWQPCVISPQGAVGLMQLMPATAKRLGVTDRCDLDQNVSGDWSEVDYWLDLGNNADSGQFVLGEPLNRRNRRRGLRLRTVSELFPEVIQTELDGDDLPSCSAAEALDRQEPFVNPTLANHALALLARLFRYGTISYHGGFVSMSSLSSVHALRVDPKHWQWFRSRRRLSRNL